MPSTAPCVLRADPKTGAKGVASEEPAADNQYNHNFKNKFCGCDDSYDPHQEKGTMFQCLGLGTVETGGCGEDWWHPECLVGLARNQESEPRKPNETPIAGEGAKGESDTNAVEVPQTEEESEDPALPPGFPGEDDFETFICYKCLDSNPWLKRYAGTPGFLPPVYKQKPQQESPGFGTTQDEAGDDQPSTSSKKRKVEEDEISHGAKRVKEEPASESTAEQQAEATATSANPEAKKHDALPTSSPQGTFSLFLREDFRDHLCHCPTCFPRLKPHPQLREEEEVYEPPLSENGEQNGNNSAGSAHTGSLLDRGEAALSNVDRVRAIEGVMVYNHLRDKVKQFLTPFAESGQAVGAEDIKSYFEKLRGDDQGIREASGQASASKGEGNNEGDDGNGNGNDTRKEQSGKLIISASCIYPSSPSLNANQYIGY